MRKGWAVNEPKYLGNFSAVDPAYSRYMTCDRCNVSWTGCWDNFQCPQCGEGDLPTADFKSMNLSIYAEQKEGK